MAINGLEGSGMNLERHEVQQLVVDLGMERALQYGGCFVPHWPGGELAEDIAAVLRKYGERQLKEADMKNGFPVHTCQEMELRGHLYIAASKCVLAHK